MRNQGESKARSLAEIHQSLVLPEDGATALFKLAVERARTVLSNIKGANLWFPDVDLEKLEFSYSLELIYSVRPEVGGHTFETNYHTKARARIQRRTARSAAVVTDMSLDDATRVLGSPLGKQLKAFILYVSQCGFSLRQVMGWPCSDSTCKQPSREGWLEFAMPLWRAPGELINGLEYELVILLAHVSTCHNAGVKLDVACDLVHHGSRGIYLDY